MRERRIVRREKILRLVVDDNQRPILVRREMLDRSIGTRSIAGGEEAQHMVEIVVAAHGGDPRDRRRVLLIARRQQRQTAGEADRQDADLLHAELLRECLRGGADHVGGLRLDVIICDAGDERRHDEEAAGRERSREANQPRLIDAQLVHAMHDNNARREADATRQVNARGNRLPAKVERGVVHVDGMYVVVGDPAAGMWIGNASQKRSRSQIILRDGIQQRDHHRKQQQEPRNQSDSARRIAALPGNSGHQERGGRAVAAM